jgi:hypothetical protein
MYTVNTETCATVRQGTSLNVCLLLPAAFLWNALGSNNQFRALNAQMIYNPLAYFYTAVHLLNNRKPGGCYTHRGPISPCFAGTVPGVRALNIVTAKKKNVWG